MASEKQQKVRTLPEVHKLAKQLCDEVYGFGNKQKGVTLVDFGEKYKKDKEGLKILAFNLFVALDGARMWLEKQSNELVEARKQVDILEKDKSTSSARYSDATNREIV